MSGFKLKLPPAPPRVLAAPGQLACGEKSGIQGVTCGRPAGHAGGHLCATPSRYWQAEEES